ncbi:RNA-directed DNA polymerase [Nocardia asiatica]
MVGIDREFLDRGDVCRAVGEELRWHGRLLPRREDFELLSPQVEAVADWLIPQLSAGAFGRRASVVFAEKEWRGTRPLHTLTLEDSVLYRVLVRRLSRRLPERLRERVSVEEFRRAPLEVSGTNYVCVTDVSAYYEFVDHDLLATELVSQTGDELAVTALRGLLATVLGRQVGIPQVHTASDLLGDVYIDPVRRRLLRRGHATFTYSDDFRIAVPTLQTARDALEACEFEVRALGLVLNETKTLTYGRGSYDASLSAFAEARQRLLDPEGEGESDIDLGLLERGYETEEADADSDTGSQETAFDDEGQRRLEAGRRAFKLWTDNVGDSDLDAQDGAALRSLLGRALPVLGAAGDTAPARWIETIIREEPALTPQAAQYLTSLGKIGPDHQRVVRATLGPIVSKDILGTWQSLWFAHVAAHSGADETSQPYEQWLHHSVTTGAPAVAATAAAALGRIGRGDPEVVTAAIARVGPEWRRLAFVGLIGLDRAKAHATADDALDRLLLTAAADEQ